MREPQCLKGPHPPLHQPCFPWQVRVWLGPWAVGEEPPTISSQANIERLLCSLQQHSHLTCLATLRLKILGKAAGVGSGGGGVGSGGGGVGSGGGGVGSGGGGPGGLPMLPKGFKPERSMLKGKPEPPLRARPLAPFTPSAAAVPAQQDLELDVVQPPGPGLGINWHAMGCAMHAMGCVP
jgi:hypothetical protein